MIVMRASCFESSADAPHQNRSSVDFVDRVGRPVVSSRAELDVLYSSDTAAHMARISASTSSTESTSAAGAAVMNLHLRSYQSRLLM